MLWNLWHLKKFTTRILKKRNSFFIMKKFLLIILVLLSLSSSAQKNTQNWQSYTAIDYMLLFNPNSDKDSYYDGNTNQWEEPSKFVLAGLAGHFEYGISYKQWIRLGGFSGIYLNVFDNVYTVPFAASLTLAPALGDDFRIYAKFASGWNTAIGRGNLNSDFHHYHFGVEFGGGSRLFLFVSDHGFRLKNEVYRTLGIGFGGTLFKDKK